MERNTAQLRRACALVIIIILTMLMIRADIGGSFGFLAAVDIRPATIRHSIRTRRHSFARALAVLFRNPAHQSSSSKPPSELSLIVAIFTRCQRGLFQVSYTVKHSVRLAPPTWWAYRGRFLFFLGACEVLGACSHADLHPFGGKKILDTSTRARASELIDTSKVSNVMKKVKKIKD